jgi:hypothetical protein
MLKRKGQNPSRFSDAMLLNWLAWLARQMADHRQTVFLVERIQPSWIRGQSGRWTYALTSRATGWTLLGLVLAIALLVFTLTFVPSGDTVAEFAATSLSAANVLASVDLAWRLAGRFTLIGLVAGLICGARFAFNTRRGSTPGAEPRSIWTPVGNVISASVLPPLAVLIPRLGASFAAAGASLITTIVGLALVDLPTMFLSAIAFRAWGSGNSPYHDIFTVDALNWSWLPSLKGAIAGFAAGCLLGSALALTFVRGAPGLAWLITILFVALPVGLVLGAALGLVAGLRASIVESAPASNRWVIVHARNALAAGVMLGAGLGLCGAISAAAPAVLAHLTGNLVWPQVIIAVGVGATCALVFGAVGALHYGGFSLLQHVIVRLILVTQRRIPWRLSHIASQAEDLAFLRRVGTGYIFIHRLMLEYFGALPEA